MSRDILWKSENDLLNEVGISILGIRNRFRGTQLIQTLDSIGIQYSLVDGFDGSEEKIPQDWKNNKRSHFMAGRPLTDAEIACAWGHWQVLKIGWESQVDWILVIEDNVEALHIFDIYQALRRLQSTRPTLISFYYDSRFTIDFNRNKLKCYIDLRRCFTIPTTTKCYAVNLSGQKKLISDYEKFGFEGYLADFPLFYGRGLNILRSNTFPININSSDSIIGSRKNLAKSARYKRIVSSKHGLLFSWLRTENSSIFIFMRFTLFRSVTFTLNSLVSFIQSLRK